MVAKDALVEMVSDLHTQGLVPANRLLKCQKYFMTLIITKYGAQGKKRS